MKVCIPETNVCYDKMFTQRWHTIVDTIEEADIVVFTGGADVSPAMYGQADHPTTQVDVRRDRDDKYNFLKARRLGKPMVGICRGAQFLNVMCGGTLYQHVDNHFGRNGDHMMVDLTSGAMFEVTSTHHQMMKPGSDADILGVASESTVYEYMDEGKVAKYYPERGEDVEVLYYSKPNCLCFQGHPEFMPPNHVAQQYFFRLIQEFSLCAD